MISNLKSIEENKEYLKSVIGIRGKFIDWKNSIGKEIKYEYYWYNDEYSKDVLKIREYKKGKVYFEGYGKGVVTDSVIRCKLGDVLGFKTSEFRYEIGKSINGLTIIDRKDKKDEKEIRRKYYKYKCNNCGNKDWITEGCLKRGQGCNACCPSPRKAVLGINTIWDKARWMIDLGISIEDSKKYMPNDTKEVYVKCPDCGRTKKITLNKIYTTHSIRCSCRDGVSYPEKLMESVLAQLNVKYERQYKTNWSQNKRYDFYLQDYNTIIEVHGEQHYKETSRGRSLKEEQENDKSKEESALKNGIKHYIVIDCRKSELEFIRLNILDSELNRLFDLSNINWNKCEECALKNKIKEVCDYYNKHIEMSSADLGKEFGINRTTIINYLNKGSKLGWCKYDGKEKMKSSNALNGKLNGKPVLQFTLEGEFIKTYPSTMEVERQTGINNSSISACCNGKQKTAGGFIWKYAE